MTAPAVPALDETAAGPPAARRERVLDPIARTSEILFGLIMALTFTGTISAATGGREEVRSLLVAAIACNIAWGLVDAAMFLMSALADRGRDMLTVRAVRSAATPHRAHRAIAAALPPLVASILSVDDLEKVRQGLLHIREPPRKASLTSNDYLGALAVFLLVLFSTFPIVIPFLVFRGVHVALRVSNLVAIVMMFVLGYRLGQYGGHHPLRTGLSLVLLGLTLVAVTIALGG